MRTGVTDYRVTSAGATAEDDTTPISQSLMFKRRRRPYSHSHDVGRHSASAL
jgi:hypothetical protein